MTRSCFGCFVAEDRAFVLDRPKRYGTVIGQLQRLERLMNNHSKSQRKQKWIIWPIYHPRYLFNIWPLALTIHWVTKGRTRGKTSVRLYPTENSFDLFGTLTTIMEEMVLVHYDKNRRMLEVRSFKTPTAPKSKKKKKDQMPCPPPGKRSTSTDQNRGLK